MAKVYDGFADFYSKGPYTAFSRRVAELLPPVLERFGVKPKRVLDLACGEGTFAVIMAERGLRATGVDASPRMLHHARQRAHAAGVEVTFLEQDIRALDLADSFDLVTCWYDSLNYVLDYDDLVRVFSHVRRVLHPQGLFIFDMNTLRGLARWREHGTYVQQDKDTLFEVHRADYDYENNIAALKITGFVREGELWRRVDEEHRERGYPLGRIREALGHAGLDELACWANLGEMTEPKPDSVRVFFVTRPKAASTD